RFRLNPFFYVDGRVSARRVDETKDGPVDLFRELHYAQGFSIAFRFRHPEVAKLSLLCVAPFLMADSGHGHSVETGKSTNDRRVFRVAAVAMKFDKVFE